MLDQRNRTRLTRNHYFAPTQPGRNVSSDPRIGLPESRLACPGGRGHGWPRFRQLQTRMFDSHSTTAHRERDAMELREHSHIPAGTYTCNKPIIINRERFKLLGAGHVVLRLADHSNCPLLIMGNVETPPRPLSNIEVSHLTIDGNRENQDRMLISKVHVHRALSC